MKLSTRAIWQALKLGLAHGLADAATGFAIVSFADFNPTQAIVVVIAYNALAFAIQPLLGLFVDQLEGHRNAALFGIFTVALGLAITPFNAAAGLGIIAIGSASFHVGAGALSARFTPNRAIGPSLFTAPGVIGLTLGTVAGLQHWTILAPLTLLLVASLIAIYSTPNSGPTITKSFPRQSIAIVVIMLLIAVALRSSIWVTVGQATSNLDGILVVGLLAGVGKLLGGWLGDKFGWGITASLGVLVAVLCFTQLPGLLGLGLGVVALQSSTPILLAAVVKLMPRFPATASGLVLGLALVLGGILAHFAIASDGLDSLSILGVAIMTTGLTGLGLYKFNQFNSRPE